MQFVQLHVVKPLPPSCPVSINHDDSRTKTMLRCAAVVARNRKSWNVTPTLQRKAALLFHAFRWLQEIRWVGYWPNYSSTDAPSTRSVADPFALRHAKISRRFALGATTLSRRTGLLKRLDDPLT